MKNKITRKNRSHKTAKSSSEIDKNMTFAELMEKYPKAAGELFQSGMNCVGCEAAAFETIEQGALAHGMNPDELVKKLNKSLKKK